MMAFRTLLFFFKSNVRHLSKVTLEALVFHLKIHVCEIDRAKVTIRFDLIKKIKLAVAHPSMQTVKLS